jgi:two-component system chemotaxis response regulator CheB
MKQPVNLIVMGGSWGGLHASLSILSGLPENFSIPIVLVLHRLKNFESDLQGVYRNKVKLEVREIEEKEKIKQGNVYIAPSNYHVLIERNQTFSLDVSEYENYSRPSIDVTFSSAAEVFGANTAGVLLSGASKDGSKGLKNIKEEGGLAIAQDPSEAEVDIMPKAGISLIPDCRIFTLNKIKEFLVSLQ